MFVAQRETEYEVLAERQGGVRLIEFADVDRVRFSVEEIDAEGAVVDSVSYMNGDLFAAIDEFDRRALRLLHPAVAAAAAIMTKMINAVGGHQIESLEELLDDGFHLVDHRPIGLPNMDRAELIEATSIADGSQARYLKRTLHAVDEAGAVVTGGFWRDHFGEWTEYFVSVAIIMVEQGRVALNELFSEDDLEVALARFAELVACPDTSA